MKPTFFASPAAWHAWLEQHHAEAAELWVGFYKKDSGKPSITWPESVDGALCFGWIDGIRKRIDQVAYVIRFTPRRARSTWSAINIRRVSQLAQLKLMRPAGLKAFQRRTGNRSEIYAYEQRKKPKFTAAQQKQFRADKKTWAFFQSQPPSYRKTATWWVISAKKEETRQKRLAQLIEDSRHQRRIGPLTPPGAQ